MPQKFRLVFLSLKKKWPSEEGHFLASGRSAVGETAYAMRFFSSSSTACMYSSVVR
jgi:hypothetical protein